MRSKMLQTFLRLGAELLSRKVSPRRGSLPAAE